MGQVGITNPFMEVPEDQYHEYGIPGIHPTGIGRFGDSNDPCDPSFVGPLSPDQTRMCRGEGHTFDQGIQIANDAFKAGKKAAGGGGNKTGSELTKHLTASPFGVPNWVLYAGGGILGIMLLGGRE